MPISPSPTQVGLSVANAAELSAVSVTQSSAGEIAYKKDDKTYWSLDLTAAAPTGFPTASGQGRWIPFPTGGGSPAILNSDWSYADATVGAGPNFVYSTAAIPAKTMGIRFPTPAGPPAPAAWESSAWAAPFANAATLCLLWYDAPADGSAPPLQIGPLGVLYPGEKAWLAQYPAGTQLIKEEGSATPQSTVTDWYVSTLQFGGNRDTNNGSVNFPLASLAEIWNRNGGVFNVNTTIHLGVGAELDGVLNIETNEGGFTQITVVGVQPLVADGPTSGLVGYVEHNTPVGANNPSLVNLPLTNPQITNFPAPIFLLDGANNEIDFAWILSGNPDPLTNAGFYVVSPWHVGGIAAPGVPYTVQQEFPDGIPINVPITHAANVQVTYVHVQPFYAGQQSGDSYDRCLFGDAGTPAGSAVDNFTPYGTLCTTCCFTGSQSFASGTYSLSKCALTNDTSMLFSNSTVNISGATFYNTAIAATGGAIVKLVPGSTTNSSDVGFFGDPGNNITAIAVTSSALYLNATGTDFGTLAPILYGGAPGDPSLALFVGPPSRGVVIAANSYFSIDPSYVGAPIQQPTLLASLPANHQITVGLAGVPPNTVVAGAPGPQTPLTTWLDLFNIATFNGTAINLAIGAFIGTPA